MGDLVLRAVIEAIECAPVGFTGGYLDWVVRTAVEEVVSGEFARAHFWFRVHSPARAGLEVGQHITIAATRVEGGYRVDENQFR